MRKIPGLLLAAAVAFSCAAAEDGGPPVIRFDAGTKATPVAATGSVAELPDPDKLACAGVAPDSLAARLTVENRRYDWTPSENAAKASGGAAIADAALSPDGSVLAILETRGRRPGPFGSRLVFLAAANGTVLRIFDVPGAKLCERLLFSGKDDLLLLEHAQSDTGENALHKFDLAEFRLAETPLLKLTGRLSDLKPAPDGRVFGKFADTEELIVLDGEKSVLYGVREKGGVLAFASGEKTLYCTRPGALVRYRLLKGEVVFDRAFDLPGNWTPAFLRIPEPAKDDWLLAGCEDGKAAVCFPGSSGSSRALDGDCGGTAAWEQKTGRLFLPLEKRLSLGFFNLPGAVKPFRVVDVNRMRPKTRGEIRELYLLPGAKFALLALDDRANLIRFTEGRRGRFQKELLAAPLDR